MIIQNAVICNKCDDFIVSKHVHDFVTCKCGAISVDGGQEYLRRSGDLSAATDMSWELPDELYRACAGVVQEAIDTNRNKFGIANAVMRKLREYDRIIADGEARVLAANMFVNEIMVEEADGTINRYMKVLPPTDEQLEAMKSERKVDSWKKLLTAQTRSLVLSLKSLVR